MAEQKASLNERTRRHLTPTEGGWESNGQGELPEETQVGSWLLFMVHGRQKGPTQLHAKQKQKVFKAANACKFQQFPFRLKVSCVFNLISFFFRKQAKQKKTTKER